jgi:hypothetical protein
MLPDFTPEGLLPPTEHGLPYRCTRDEIYERFVVDRGSPDWRVRLFEGWDLVRLAVADVVPSATWWLWGCFVSSHELPLFGADETVSSIVILPAREVLREAHRRALLVEFLQSAEENHRVDVGIVYDFDTDHPDHLETIEALEFNWRPRASQGIADHATRELVDAGFLEVAS